MMFTPNDWIQLIMNNGVMPGLVVWLFVTMQKNNREDKDKLMEQLEAQTKINQKVMITLEKMDLRLANIERGNTVEN